MEQLVDLGEQAIFILMAIASVMAVAVGFERAFVFSRSVSKSESILKEIISKLRTHEVGSLRDLEGKSPKNIYARFASFSAEHYDKGHDSLSELMAGRVVSEKIELEKRLPILSTLGNNAPFLGLLGTVLGVIKAFNGLGTLGNSGAEVVMKSISTALLAMLALVRDSFAGETKRMGVQSQAAMQAAGKRRRAAGSQ
jgi:biopolymer transport protein ExbB